MSKYPLYRLDHKAPPKNPKSKLIIGTEVSLTYQNFIPFLVLSSIGSKLKTSLLKKLLQEKIKSFSLF